METNSIYNTNENYHYIAFIIINCCVWDTTTLLSIHIIAIFMD